MITIISVRQLWKDKIYFKEIDLNKYEVVDEVSCSKYVSNDLIHLVYLVSTAGIRNICIYETEFNKTNHRKINKVIKKGKKIYSRELLNVDQAIAINSPIGEVFPTLIVEYFTIDYMKVTIEWSNSLKDGGFYHLVYPKHTIKSFCYYFFT